MTASAPQIVAYLVASLLFILSLRGLSTQETARRGNALGILGMLLAVGVTAFALLWPLTGHAELRAAQYLAGAVIIGAVVGATLAKRVAMTSMPELTAILHSFVGLAAVLVGWATYLGGVQHEAGETAHRLEIFIGVLVGGLTFTGSVIAFLKLRGTLKSKALRLPGRHLLDLGMVALCVVAAVPFLRAVDHTASMPLLVMTAVSFGLGAHLVMSIGGGDMPVVVSLLNSYSGWAAAAAGFMLGNDLLIITGALVGSSGAILSYIMCTAMNRSIWNVVFGGIGPSPKALTQGDAPVGTYTTTNVAEVVQLLEQARRVVVVPGYGMAVAQAQHAVREITSLLAGRGCKVAYAIHPVAGRLPGHMNVLLAEAGVSYEIVHEMEEVNHTFPETDVVLVVGANDIVNPSALEDPASPIYGMPILHVWNAGKVVMLKRSMSAGYAGVDNPLAYRENTLMLFGDAKASVTGLLEALRRSSTAAAA